MIPASHALPQAAVHAWLAAAAVGAVAAFLAMGSVSPSPLNALAILLFALACALLIAAVHLLIAVPAYLLLSSFMSVGWRTCGLAGFLIGLAPVTLLSGPALADMVEPILLFGLPGLAGGLAFAWRLARDEA